MPRAKRDFGTIRRRRNGRYQAYYLGPDQTFHRAPSTFQTRADAEAWLAHERRLIQDDDWSPTRSRRAKVRRTAEAFGPYALAWLEHRDLKPRTRALYAVCWSGSCCPPSGRCRCGTSPPRWCGSGTPSSTRTGPPSGRTPTGCCA